MPYLPQMPGVPAPMSYGQGYGNWQQYAGYNQENPFGSVPSINPSKGKPVAPAVPIAPVVPVAPVGVQPAMPTGQFGSQPTANLGSAPVGQFGSLEDAVADDEKNY